MRVEQHVLGLGARARQPTGHRQSEHSGSGPGPLPMHLSSGGPLSVGSKSGFFQAKIGPVDGQSLSVLSGRIQAESGRQKAKQSWGIVPHLLSSWVPTFRTMASAPNVLRSLCRELH